MKITKAGPVLTFVVPKGTFSYNLATGETIGLSGRRVESLASQLKGVSITEVELAFEDVCYAKLFRCVAHVVQNDALGVVTAPSTVFARWRRYRNLEQYFAAEVRVYSSMYKIPMGDVPKWLIKAAKAQNIMLIPAMVSFAREFGADCQKILADEDTVKFFEDMARYFDVHLTSKEILVERGYDMYRIAKFLNWLARYEGLSNVSHNIAELADYAKQSNLLYRKYDKFPRYFASRRQIVNYNYAQKAKESTFQRDAFVAAVDKRLDADIDGYKFRHARSCDEMREYAGRMHNCLVSYIPDVIDGTSKIVFAEHPEEVNKVLAIEVRRGRIVQIQGICCRSIDAGERVLRDKYQKHLNRIYGTEQKTADEDWEDAV